MSCSAVKQWIKEFSSAHSRTPKVACDSLVSGTLVGAFFRAMQSHLRRRLSAVARVVVLISSGGAPNAPPFVAGTNG